MDSGVISKSLAAIRNEPSETSEMVNQMLFGESFDIIEKHKSWLKIAGHLDGYHGWVDEKLISKSDEYDSSKIDAIASNLFKAKQEALEFPLTLCPGSILKKYSNGNFFCGNNQFEQLENPFDNISVSKEDAIQQIAKKYINAPYLWGGRSPFGIDCSGLVQVVYRIAGVNLPRDASQQATLGHTIEFIDNIKPGDLAFFDNEEGSIIHVGIISENNQIIHCSGFVRIDRFDHQGIFNIQNNHYSHKLRVIKRVL